LPAGQKTWATPNATVQSTTRQPASTTPKQAMPAETAGGSILGPMPAVSELSKSVIVWLLILPIAAILFMYAVRLWRTMPEKPTLSRRHDHIALIPGVAAQDTIQVTSPVDAMIGIYQLLSESDQKEFRLRINQHSK
jgi:hypothetical protein